MITIEVSGKSKSGKSIAAQEIRYRLERLGAVTTVEDDSPNTRYKVNLNSAFYRVPLRNTMVRIIVKSKAK